MVGHIPGDNTTGPDQGPPADADAAANRGVGSNGGTKANTGGRANPIHWLLKRKIGIDRTRMQIIRKADMRPNEHAIFNGYPVKDRGIVLDLDLSTDPNVGINVHTTSNHHISSDFHSLPDLDKIPDLCAVTY